ncbi:MAG: pyruvate kinase [Thermoplasmata archaeon]
MGKARIKKTKIVATLGPATEDTSVLREMISAGMDVARVNFSHGSHEEHRTRIRAVREAAEKEGRIVAVLGDLGGPKIRIGEFANGRAELVAGKRFRLTTRDVPGDETEVSVNYPRLPVEVKVDETILLADGAVELRVVDRNSTDVICEVVSGGVITSRKGVNLPSSRLKTPAVTEKDKEDIAFSVKEELDYLAISFVRTVRDVKEAKAVLETHATQIPLIAKIEKAEALSDLENILTASDGVMIARGDLGVEIPFEKIPIVQKEVMKRARGAGKPVITATQMLKSMVESPRPTRAETTDVANAILDGTDAVMLSEETAVGRYPVEAVKTMALIAVETEASMDEDWEMRPELSEGRRDLQNAIARAVMDAATHPEASVIVTPSARGTTPMRVSRLRPRVPILMLTENRRIARRFALIWGVIPICVKMPGELSEVFRLAGEEAKMRGLLAPGELAVVTAGYPIFGTPTNLIYIYKRPNSPEKS